MEYTFLFIFNWDKTRDNGWSNMYGVDFIFVPYLHKVLRILYTLQTEKEVSVK